MIKIHKCYKDVHAVISTEYLKVWDMNGEAEIGSNIAYDIENLQS